MDTYLWWEGSSVKSVAENYRHLRRSPSLNYCLPRSRQHGYYVCTFECTWSRLCCRREREGEGKIQANSRREDDTRKNARRTSLEIWVWDSDTEKEGISGEERYEEWYEEGQTDYSCESIREEGESWTELYHKEYIREQSQKNTAWIHPNRDSRDTTYHPETEWTINSSIFSSRNREVSWPTHVTMFNLDALFILKTVNEDSFEKS